MSEITRGDFIKIAWSLTKAVGVGTLVGLVGSEIDTDLEQRASDAGIPTGNASYNSHIQKQCSANPALCEGGYKYSDVDRFIGVGIGPLGEELVFRALPSAYISHIEGGNPRMDAIFGLDEYNFTRRELIAGVASGLLFGLGHNITNKVFDTRTLPISQTTAGMVYWVMQRKFGVVSNTLAHSLSNYLVIRKAT